MHTSYLIKEIHKGKQKVVEFEVGMILKLSEIDEDPVHLETMKSVS